MKEYRLVYDAHGALQISDSEGLLGFVITAKALAQGIAEGVMAEHLRELDKAVLALGAGSRGKRTKKGRAR